ncbi:MAG: DUF2252 family protein [Chitinophagaceae bacterium]
MATSFSPVSHQGSSQGASVAERIKHFNAHLLPDKVKVKYKLLSEDPFRFFRGTCHLFYEDLAKASLPDTPVVWLCGDLHLENFGSFKGDNRLVYFDINDFDECMLGPASWDIARMVTSIITGFRFMKVHEDKVVEWAKLFLATYSDFLCKGKARFIEIETAEGMVRSFLENAASHTQRELLQKRLHRRNRQLLIKTDEKKYLELDEPLRESLKDHVHYWTQQHKEKLGECKVLDAVFKIAGTGSLGVQRYVLLLQTNKGKIKYRLMEMKQIMPSSLRIHTTIWQPDWSSEAERVAAIKQRMQNVSPALLDATIFDGQPFLMQEMQPTEDKIDFETIKDNYKNVSDVLCNMALLTASGQLRSSGRQGSAIADELIAFGSKDGWQQDILDYALQYSNKVAEDYEAFKKAYKNKFFS